MTPSQALYPLKFVPIYKEKLWGGQKIRTVLGQDFGDLANCGESWVISDVPGEESIVSVGPLAGLSLRTLMLEYGDKLTGQIPRLGDDKRFPLLVKFLDAAQDLSVQVHPNDTLAMARHGSLGKSEMWYIIEADPEATLISGFTQKFTPAQYRQKLEAGSIMDMLCVEKVEAGDSFFIPAGRVHTIGKGILLAEIQQTSDITYRIYDFDRLDKAGKKRELHTELAMEALDFEAVGSQKIHAKPAPGTSALLAECAYFATRLIHVERRMVCDYSFLGSFVILTCVKGSAYIKNEVFSTPISAGEAVLVPAQCGQIGIWSQANCELLETYVPKASSS